MKPTLFLSTLAAVAFGAFAANAVSPGLSQLAVQAGVEPGAYTASELARLIEAKRDNDAELVRFILNHGAADASDAVGTAGNAQFEGTLGVEAGRYTTAELVAISNARLENDAEAEAYVRSGANRAAPADASVVTPGEAQIAAGLNLDPARYTLADLAALLPHADD